jgi:hypothetical protein
VLAAHYLRGAGFQLVNYANGPACERRRLAVAIHKDDFISLMNAFHDVVMFDKGSAEDQAKFFLHPDPRIIVLHGEDISMQTNYEIHQRLTDEKHIVMDDWQVSQLCDQPERARGIGAVYWEGRLIDSPDGALIKAIVGEDWVVQRMPSGELKIALYINSYHHFLPDSAPIELQ